MPSYAVRRIVKKNYHCVFTQTSFELDAILTNVSRMIEANGHKSKIAKSLMTADRLTAGRPIIGYVYSRRHSENSAVTDRVAAGYVALAAAVALTSNLVYVRRKDDGTERTVLGRFVPRF